MRHVRNAWEEFCGVGGWDLHLGGLVDICTKHANNTCIIFQVVEATNKCRWAEKLDETNCLEFLCFIFF